MTRFLIAPQEFKGSLTATEAARIIAAGVRDALPDAVIVEAPMSDGGPGLVDAMLAALGGERIDSEAHDPLMRPIRPSWARLANGTAVIEMAAAAGLVLLRSDERDPLVATTYGSGELVRAALDRGCERIIVGVGGSATVDGGAGTMQALGARLLDAAGDELPPGGGPLARLNRIDASGCEPRLARAAIRVAADVTNTLCGPTGAALMFGPQKGASVETARSLDDALAHFASIVRRDLGIDIASLRGGGAAGGLAAGLAAIAGATVEPGFDIVAEATGLDAAIAACDIVITGEGRLDAQTAYGKTAAGVAAIARTHGKRVAIIAGSIDASYDAAGDTFERVESLLSPRMSIEEAMRDSATLLRAAAARVTREMHAG
jgi:glycerate kinase